jgi:hypothetical protein
MKACMAILFRKLKPENILIIGRKYKKNALTFAIPIRKITNELFRNGLLRA